jgi:hypothetical protein
VSENFPVSIQSFRTEPEALSAATCLESEGIPCRVHRIDPSGLGPIVASSESVELLVAPEYEKRARELLTSFDQGLPEPSLSLDESVDTKKTLASDATIRAAVERIRRRLEHGEAGPDLISISFAAA